MIAGIGEAARIPHQARTMAGAIGWLGLMMVMTSIGLVLARKHSHLSPMGSRAVVPLATMGLVGTACGGITYYLASADHAEAKRLIHQTTSRAEQEGQLTQGAAVATIRSQTATIAKLRQEVAEKSIAITQLIALEDELSHNRSVLGRDRTILAAQSARYEDAIKALKPLVSAQPVSKPV